MAWKVHRKYVLRRKKARRNQRNRALFWVWGGSDLIYSDEVPYGRTQVSRTVYELEEDEHGELRSVERRRSYTHLYRDLAHFNRLTEEEFWAFRDRFNAEQRSYHERRVHLSQETHSSGGAKWAKRKYHRLRRAQLPAHQIGGAVGGKLHLAAAEALQVGKPRMRADADAAGHRITHHPRHHVPVAGMDPAGDIGRADDPQQRGVVAHCPGAETLAQIGVQIHGSHCSLPSAVALTTPPIRL